MHSPHTVLPWEKDDKLFRVYLCKWELEFCFGGVGRWPWHGEVGGDLCTRKGTFCYLPFLLYNFAPMNSQ